MLTSPHWAGVETVTLDPMAGFPAGVSAALVGVGKERFVERLVGLHEEHGGHGGVSPREGKE